MTKVKCKDGASSPFSEETPVSAVEAVERFFKFFRGSRPFSKTAPLSAEFVQDLEVNVPSLVMNGKTVSRSVNLALSIDAAKLGSAACAFVSDDENTVGDFTPETTGATPANGIVAVVSNPVWIQEANSIWTNTSRASFGKILRISWTPSDLSSHLSLVLSGSDVELVAITPSGDEVFETWIFVPAGIGTRIFDRRGSYLAAYDVASALTVSAIVKEGSSAAASLGGWKIQSAPIFLNDVTTGHVMPTWTNGQFQKS